MERQSLKERVEAFIGRQHHQHSTRSCHRWINSPQCNNLSIALV
jgi:hypothetical protein